MDVRVICIILSLALFGCSQSVEKLNKEDTQEHQGGVKFYQQRCDVCHGPDGKLGVSEAKDLSKSTISESEVEQIVKNGKGAMPPFEHALESDSTLIELVEHIKSLRE